MSCAGGGTTPWMSPELFDPNSFGLEKSCLTEKSDCYAMGMVIYEVLSGHTPFSQFDSLTITGKVLAGRRPQRPEGEEGRLFTDAIWRLLELCWKPQPSDRPSAKYVLSCLEGSPREDGGVQPHHHFASTTPLVTRVVRKVYPRRRRSQVSTNNYVSPIFFH